MKDSCLVCKEPINVGAKKCIHCNSYQNWRRHLDFSTNILALLVALVSVLAFALPIIKENLLPQDSKLLVSYQMQNNGKLYLIASNSGELAGHVVDCYLTFPFRSWYLEEHTDRRLQPDKRNPEKIPERNFKLEIDGIMTGATFIKKNESKQIGMQLDGEKILEDIDKTPLSIEEYVLLAEDPILTVRTREFSGGGEYFELKLGYQDVNDFLETSLEKSLSLDSP